MNIDEFFVPAQKKISQEALQIQGEAQQRFEKNSQAVRRQILLFSLAGAGIIAVVTILSGVWCAATISRPLEHLDIGVQQLGEGDFAVTVTETGFKEVNHWPSHSTSSGTSLPTTSPSGTSSETPSAATSPKR